MKKLLSVFAFAAISLFTSAHADSVVAPGRVVYKMPSGELVFRNLSLEVPSRGAGDVILRAGEFETKAHAFKSHEQNGRIVFCVLFLNPPGAPANTVALYKGTYLRGTNLAMYYGDVFAGTYSDENKALEIIENMKLDAPNFNESHPDMSYAAGFHFSVAIPK